MENQQIGPAPSYSNLPLIIAIVVVILLAAGAGVYFYFGNLKFTNVVSKISPLNPNCRYNDPDLCKFVNNWKTVDYFTITSTSTFEGQKEKSVIKSVGDNRFQITGFGGEIESLNTIMIDDTTYTKDYEDGKWVKSETTPENTHAKKMVDLNLDFNNKAELAEDQTRYEKVGMESCGALTCFKYQVADPSIPDSTEYVLFDNKDYLLRKTVSIGLDNNRAESEFDYSKISIDIPSPIKEEPAI